MSAVRCCQAIQQQAVGGLHGAAVAAGATIDRLTLHRLPCAGSLGTRCSSVAPRPPTPGECAAACKSLPGTALAASVPTLPQLSSHPLSRPVPSRASSLTIAAGWPRRCWRARQPRCSRTSTVSASFCGVSFAFSHLSHLLCLLLRMPAKGWLHSTAPSDLSQHRCALAVRSWPLTAASLAPCCRDAHLGNPLCRRQPLAGGWARRALSNKLIAANGHSLPAARHRAFSAACRARPVRFGQMAALPRAL